MASRKITDLHPNLQPLCQKFLDLCHAENIDAFITCTYRSDTEQNADYAKGRTAPGKIVTNARAGQSKHNFTIDGKPASKAFDFAILEIGGVNWNPQSKPWKRAIEIGESLGLTSGSRWKSLKDYPHFELTEKGSNNG